MCGIAGIVSLGRPLPPDAAGRMQGALQGMANRGPDDSRILHCGPHVLGHTRLAIMDLSAAAGQPMNDPSGRYTLVFNGTIFNYQELRTELRGKGISFQTRSDTEVLLHWLIIHGIGGLHRLNGFFALGFCDSHEDTWLIARDRYGEKPLWYASGEGILCFASGSAALRSLIPSEDLDTTSIATYLTCSYIPAPHTVWKNLHKLMPGHALTCRGGSHAISRWYHDSDATDDESLELLLADSVRIRLASEVRHGCFLSGGLDSSIIAALIMRHTGHLRTFSVSFPDAPYLDEADDARQVAEHLGCHHTTIPVSEAELLRSLDRFIYSIDEPFADASSLALQALCAAVSHDIRVALTGDGADELFAGYRKHIALVRAASAGAMERMLMRSLVVPLALAPTSRASAPADGLRKVRRYAQGLRLDPRQRYIHWSSFCDENHLRDILEHGMYEAATQRMADAAGEPDEQLQSILRADQNLVLPNDMLVKADRMSMSASIELRSPFLDYRVVEAARRLNNQNLVQNGRGKTVLRQTFGQLLPARALDKKKQGFEIPLDRWIRHQLREEIRSLGQSPHLAALGFIRMKEVNRQMIRAVEGQDSSRTHLAFSLLVLDRWLKTQN
ncbi:MAG: asparagine synthase (glutamine-hydrolyzing) [Flavobacteriales bacterium]